MQPSGMITLTTDFGLSDGYVGQLKGVLLGINRQLTLVDLSHSVPPQAVATGAFLLAAAAAAFPAGTVHLLVVDPGVGSERHGLLARLGDHWLVGPDNGGWSYLERQVTAAGQPVAAWRLSAPRFWRPAPSRTFHGRDIFAPVAAHLASGVPPAELGQPLATPVRLPLPEPTRAGRATRGHIVHIDHFGNAITDLQLTDLPAAPARCRFQCVGLVIEGLATTYAAVATGAALALVSSFGTIELARRNGSVAAQDGLAIGAAVLVTTDELATNRPPDQLDTR